MRKQQELKAAGARACARLHTLAARADDIAGAPLHSEIDRRTYDRKVAARASRPRVYVCKRVCGVFT